jgi:hypothetical protein
MSLTVFATRRGHPQLKQPTRVFHVGERRDLLCFLEISDVWRIEATGEELQLITETITGIPVPTKSISTVIWFGDHAKFIVHNLEFF